MKRPNYVALLCLFILFTGLFTYYQIPFIEIKSVSIDNKFQSIKSTQVASSSAYSLIKAADKNSNKIHDVLDKEISNNAEDEYDVIVVLKKLDTKTISYFESLGGTVRKVFSHAITGFSGTLKGTEIIKLRDNNNVIFIQPIFRHKATMYNSIRLMKIRPYIWSNYDFYGSPEMSVAIIDSGIDPSHPMLSPYDGEANFSAKIVGWYDAVNNETTPYDDNGHGTIIAGFVGGQFYDGKIVDNTTAIQFTQFALIIDGQVEDEATYIWYDYVPIFKTGTVKISIYWKDISLKTGGLNHHAEISGLEIYNPNKQQIKSVESTANPLTVTFDANMIGPYYVRILFTMYSAGNSAGKDGPGIAFWGYCFVETKSPDEFEPYAGAAPQVKLVGVKVLDEEGIGSDEDILEGIDWVIQNKETYHIVVATITFGSLYIDPATDIAVENLAKNGIVVVAAAGNDGPERNIISSPGRVDLAITVGASTDGWSSTLNVTNWSSRGPSSRLDWETIVPGNTSKPDIVAPGGDFDEPSLICVDSNYDDNIDIYFYDLSTGEYYVYDKTSGVSDYFDNDFVVARGTSMATANMGGAAALVIQALTNGEWSRWNYTLEDVLKVKQILLLTAWEIYKGKEVYRKFNRGKKDIVEGYGFVQVDAATDAILRTIEVNQTIQDTLSTDLYEKHVWASKIYLEKGKHYVFRLTVPDDADMDMYLWYPNPDNWGQPVLAARNARDVGLDEYFAFTPSESGYYYLTVKVLSGEGQFSLIVHEISQDELISFEVSPSSGTLFETSPINVTLQCEVKYSYVSNAWISKGNNNYTFELLSISEDGKSSSWYVMFPLDTGDTRATIYIMTPINVFDIQYSLKYIPNLTAMIILSILGVAGIATLVARRYYKKKKLERLARVEEEAAKLAEKAVEEIEIKEEEE